MKDGALGAGGDKEVVRGEGIVGLLPGIERYLKDMDQSDKESVGVKSVSVDQLQSKLERLRATRERHKAMLRELESSGQKQASL